MDLPLFWLLAKDFDFFQSSPCQEGFELIKEKLTTTPILRGPNWTLPFHIHNDAFDKAVGEILGKLEDKIPYVINFNSKNLSKAKLNYIVTAKDMLAIFHDLNKFWHYVTGYQTFVHTDHATTKYLMNKPNVNARIIR